MNNELLKKRYGKVTSIIQEDAYLYGLGQLDKKHRTDVLKKIDTEILPDLCSFNVGKKYRNHITSNFDNKYELHAAGDVQLTYKYLCEKDRCILRLVAITNHKEQKSKRMRKRLRNGLEVNNDTINEGFDMSDYINYKGINIEEFSYSASYGDEEWDNTSYIIMSPYYLQSNPNKPKVYMPLYAEDDEGDVVEFPTLKDAKDYIDKYILTKAGHIRIKHGDEVHYVLD